MPSFCLRLWEKKGFHFVSKAEDNAGLPVFHIQTKLPEERDVFGDTEGATECRNVPERRSLCLSV